MSRRAWARCPRQSELLTSSVALSSPAAMALAYRTHLRIGHSLLQMYSEPAAATSKAQPPPTRTALSAAEPDSSSPNAVLKPMNMPMHASARPDMNTRMMRKLRVMFKGNSFSLHRGYRGNEMCGMVCFQPVCLRMAFCWHGSTFQAEPEGSAVNHV